MSEPGIDVVGVGNAIVDVIAEVDDSFIVDHGLVKNSMTLIDGERADLLGAAMPPGIVASGGSAANTMVGVANFGGVAAYLGLVAADDLGEVFRSDLRAAGVGFDVPGKVDGLPTARCLIQVTSDAQRTLNTYLGVSAHLSPDEIDEVLVASASHLYCEGYLWDTEEAKGAIRYAMDLAHDAGRTVSLTLSDGFCVDRHREEWLELLTDRVDVVFGNASELCSLFEVDDVEQATDAVAAEVDLAFVTLGKQGSMVVAGSDRTCFGSKRHTFIDTPWASLKYKTGCETGWIAWRCSSPGEESGVSRRARSIHLVSSASLALAVSPCFCRSASLLLSVVVSCSAAFMFSCLYPGWRSACSPRCRPCRCCASRCLR